MSPPGLRPGLVRRVLWAALVVTWSAAGLAHAPDAGASTTSTTKPWVPGKGGTMTIGIDQSPTGCNPNTSSGDTWANRLVLEPVLPSAFLIDTDGQAVYDSALITQAELQSTTPETVVYTLNPRAVWSDGEPITAADFIYTWEQERGTLGPVGSPLTPAGPTGTTSLAGATGTTGPALGYRQIKSVTGSDHGRTVTVVFKTPFADWQSLFDYLLPAHVLEQSGWDTACSTVEPSIDLSGGPFEIAKVVAGHEVVLIRNPRWWGQRPDLSRLVVKVASGPSQLARWLGRGTIDVALPAGYGEQYLETVTADPSTVTDSSISTTFLQLEFSTTSPATAQIDVRMAIAHMIDRQILVDSVVGWADSTIVPAASHLYAQPQTGYPSPKPQPLQVSGQPGNAPPPTSPTATPFPATADLVKATKLLTGLGYSRAADGTWHSATGDALSVAISVDDADSWATQALPLIARQLGSAGVGVSVEAATSAQAAGEDLSTGKADLALIPMHSSPYPSQAIAWYTPMLGPAGSQGSQDWSGIDDPMIDSLLLKASQELNPVDAAPLYTQVDTLLWQDMVALPLFAQPSLLAWSGLTDDVSPNANGPSLLWSVTTWAIRVPPTSPDAVAS